jgi:DNA polymerase-3 subunit beta
MAARVRLDAVKVTKKGRVLLPARETSALLRELTDPTVTLESTEQRCRIDSGGGSFVLLGEDPEQYPEEATVKSGKHVEIACGQMLRMIQETVFAAAREETRYAINGVLLDAGGGCLRMVATDGRRLSISYHNNDSKTAFKIVVPLRALNTLARALPEGSKEPLRIEVGDKQLRMTAESSTRGRADVTIDAVVKGAGGSINFNPDYILEALRVSQLEQVRLDMSDDSMPAKFTLGESFTYVVMPISGA